MSNQQRKVSTPLELHQLNLVNKQTNHIPVLPPRNEKNTDSSSPGGSPHLIPPVTPKKKNLAPITPVKRSIQEDPKGDPDDIIYRLAYKKREIIELENTLKFLKIELHDLEIEFKESQPEIMQTQMGSRQFQQTFDDLKSRFNNTIHSLTTQNGNLDIKATNNNNGNGNGAGGRFFKGIIDKFNEFNINEDEFDDKTRRVDVDKQFYLKDGYEVDLEEIENDAKDEEMFLNKIDHETINNFKR